jgi:RNA recognition motif-containing protein
VNIYVGNLSYEVTSLELEKAFGQFGKVVSARVINDPQSGRSRGFGFVEMSSNDDGQKAIAEMNGKDLLGREIVVNEARPKPAREGNNRPPRFR